MIFIFPPLLQLIGIIKFGNVLFEHPNQPEDELAKKTKQFTVTDGKLVLTLELAEEGGYIVTSPFNPDVLTQAETLEEAFENARDVIALYSEERKAKSRKRIRSAAK